jgi:hypothetical protein
MTRRRAGSARTQMWRRLLATIIFAMIVTSWPALALPDGEMQKGRSKEFTYDRVVLTGVASYQHDRKTCIAFASFLTSGDFFEGLRPNETTTGRKFFKGPTEIKDFPPELTLEIQGGIHDCSKFPLDPLDRDTADPFMKALKFKLYWKTGLRQRPVEKFSLQISPPNPGFEANYSSPNWRYDFTIHSSSGVPLTDHVVVEIYSEREKFLTRLSSHL